MAATKPAAPGPPPSTGRRSQPARQARTNPTRASAAANRSGAGPEPVRGSGGGAGGSAAAAAAAATAAPGNQPAHSFPAITHFADAITALPKELVRHFTLLKEVDAKIYTPEIALFELVKEAMGTPTPGQSSGGDSGGSGGGSSSSSSGRVGGNDNNDDHDNNEDHDNDQPPFSSASSSSSIFDPVNLPRRQLFRQVAFKIQEMLVALEEKNHVISTANDALDRQMGRIHDVWPHLETEFTDEAKWGSVTHWAYPENRAGKAAQAERSRREGAAAISAAAQAIADEAAAAATKPDGRKQTSQAKKNLKTRQHQDSDLDDPADNKGKGEALKKTHSQSRARKPPEPAPAAAAATASAAAATMTNGNPPTKRRKVEKPAATTTPVPVPVPPTTPVGAAIAATTSEAAAGVPMERAMSRVFGGRGGGARPPSRAASPRGTPVLAPAPAPTPANNRKRKALPSGGSHAKKAVKTNDGMRSPTPSALPGAPLLVEPVHVVGASDSAPPAPATAPAATASRPSSSRSKAASVPPAPPPPPSTDGSRARAAAQKTSTGTAAVPKPAGPAAVPHLHPPRHQHQSPTDAKSPADIAVLTKDDGSRMDRDPATPAELSAIANNGTKKEASRADEPVPRSDTAAAQQIVVTQVTTKSGRASKPSTPGVATFHEAGKARSGKKADSGTSATMAAAAAGAAATSSSTAGAATTAHPHHNQSHSNSNKKKKRTPNPTPGQVEWEVEPRYCLCNGVSYGEMIACDAFDCPKEWFHLGCMGLKIAPKANSKWYCPDCISEGKDKRDAARPVSQPK